MFGNFPFGVPYFGQPDIPQGGAVTGSGTLTQQSQYFQGQGHVPVAAQEPGGAPTNLSWWRRKVKRITLGGVEIHGRGQLEQQPSAFDGQGQIGFFGDGVLWSSGPGSYGRGGVAFKGHGRLKGRASCTKAMAKMAFKGAGAIHLRERNPTEEELISLLLNLDDIL